MPNNLQLDRLFDLAPPSTLTPDQWAEKFRILPNVHAVPGPFKVSEFEIARGWMRAATVPGTRKISIMASPQLGKSAALETIAGYFICEDPCAIMWALPTESLALSFGRERLNRMLAETPTLRALQDVGSRSGTDSILYKEFRNGSSLAVAFAGSESQVAARSARMLIADEVDRWPLLGEGDSLALAHQRVATFARNSLIAQACSPTWSATSRINREYLAGDQRKAFVQCPHCAEWTTMEFFKKPFKCATVEWHKDGNKSDPTTAHLYCGFCGGEWSELDRLRPITTAFAIRWHQCREFECCGVKQKPLEERRWRWDEAAQVGFAVCKECGKQAVPHDHASFQASKLYSQHETVVGMARRWIATREEAPESEVEFYNLFLGESADPATFGNAIEPHELAKRCEDYGELLPRGVLMLTAGADVQRDRIEVLVGAWCAGEEFYLADYQIIGGDTSQAQVWRDLFAYLNTRFYYDRDGSGTQTELRMRISGVAVDAGDGVTSQKVIDFVKFANNSKDAPWHAWATKGGADLGGKWNPIVQPFKLAKTRDSNKVEIVGTNSAKEMVYSRLKIVEPGPGCIHLPTDLPENFLEQLASEHLKYTIRNGFRSARYEPKRARAANEVLDCMVLSLVALRLLAERKAKTLLKAARQFNRELGEVT